MSSENCTKQCCIFKIDDVQLGFYYTLLIEKEINCQKLTSNLLSNKTATNESLSAPNESMSWYLKCMIGFNTCSEKYYLTYFNEIHKNHRQITVNLEGCFYNINEIIITFSIFNFHYFRLVLKVLMMMSLRIVT